MPVVSLHIDGRTIEADENTTVMDAARGAGLQIPYLCACDREGYTPIAACRSCLVEVAGEAALVPACRRKVAQGMAVTTRNDRIDNVRRLVVELTASEMGEVEFAGQTSTTFGRLARSLDVTATRFGFDAVVTQPDTSHPAVVFVADACIRCGLCRVACQDVQVNGIVALAGRGTETRITFDHGRSLGDSSCVSCGECIQVCPTGALRSGAGVAGRMPAELTIERTAETICPFCSVGCRVELGIAGNRAVIARGADGPANRGRLCVKGRFGFDYLAHPERLTVPLIRREDAPKNPELHLTGADVLTLFREATWDEALDRAAAGFLKVKEKHGSARLAVLGSAKSASEDAYVLQKLARTVLKTSHIDHCTRLCASIPPLTEAIGTWTVTLPFSHILEADVALVVGSNPEVNHPVAASFMKNAVRRGTKLILIDPYRQPFARHAAYHLQLRPATDVALLSAMTHVVIAEDLIDHAFVSQRLEGFDDLKARVSAYPPEVAARVCGVPEESIVGAARLFAKAPNAMCFWGMGASQHAHGSDNMRALIALALVTGQVGRRGAGMHPWRGQNNVQGSCDVGLLPMCLPGNHNISDAGERAFFERLWQTDIPGERGLTVVEILEAAAAGEMKGLYVSGGNPAMAAPDLAMTRRALASLEHLVVQDIFPTETAAFADVVLPAAALAERSGTVTNTDRFVQLVETAVPPPGAARPDWEITCEIATRMGARWNFDHVGAVFDEMVRAVPALAGMDWATITRERQLQYPLSADPSNGGSLFATVFPAIGGKARIAALTNGSPGELPDEQYPLILVTGRVREHWHTGSMTRRAKTLDALSPESLVHVSAADFARLDLNDRERVEVLTRRGSVRLPAVCDERLQSGVIWMAMSFFEAPANDLTTRHLDTLTRAPEYKFCAARLIRDESKNIGSDNQT